MCDGGCGQFLWCEIPCAISGGYGSCTVFTMLGIFVVLIILIGLTIRLLQSIKKSK